MTGDLLINNYDAYDTFGITMGSDFLGSLYAPADLKKFVENDNRLSHGKNVIVENPRLADRDVTLSFVLIGKTSQDFVQKKQAFEKLLYGGNVAIQVPSISDDVFHLVYEKSTSYSHTGSNVMCKIACKFNEPNPNNRS